MKTQLRLTVLIIFCLCSTAFAGQVEVPFGQVQGISHPGTNNNTTIYIKNVGTISQSIMYEFFDVDGNPLDVSISQNIQVRNIGSGTMDASEDTRGRIYIENVKAGGIGMIILGKLDTTNINLSIRITVERYSINDYGILKSNGIVRWHWSNSDSNRNNTTAASYSTQLNGGDNF